MSFREASGFGRRRQHAVLDLTPLIDCIFQLLVFFLLTASFIATPNVGLELPKASSKAAPTQQQDVRIVVTREGKVQLNGKTISLASLLDQLVAARKKSPQSRVVIQADKKAYHGIVVQALDTAKKAGFKKLGVAIDNR